MALDAHKKPILEQTPLNVSFDVDQAFFNNKEFNTAIQHHGYDVFIEKALMCPCRNKVSGAADTGCKNCGATGWFFVDKKETRAMVSHINRQTKFLPWTQENLGTVQITTLPEDDLGYMDKITLRDIETSMSHICHFHLNSAGDRLFAFLPYIPLNIEHIYLFKNRNEKLDYLDTTEYSVLDNRIILDVSFLSQISGAPENEKYLTGAIRYLHSPEYHVIDINREVSKNRERQCADGSKILKPLPISSIARKTHLVYEMPNYQGDSVFDNTNYPT